MAGSIFLAVIFLIFGFWMITVPWLLWWITESWRSKDAEGPSDLYIRISKITGVLFMIFGALNIVDIFV
ncbi:hypothetical protein SAMN04487936_101455 [Halobacillus dabanensis]|uniref:DUF6199 domain-containing protein n=1 Tax=Halobacillus dabanensis TaxID=240302 RepID=A0A1I3PW81_HALDA|nr:DUF6199 family natural product biosynthesis protein [Halobacillus dabanensis]SFJ25729.1 hypothetical protein SAMN04487936_101455 [Halobacillus dabanensis]